MEKENMTTSFKPLETVLTGIVPESYSSEYPLVVTNTSEVLKQRQEDICGQKTPISDSLEDKRKLTRLVTSCYHALRQYGKSPEELEAIIMLMQIKLAKYAYEDVRMAFDKLLDTATQVPTPAEVIAIVDPSTQPRKWSATAFIDIKRRIREGQFVPKSEIQYCKDYIQAQLDESANNERQDAVRQVAIQDKSYWSIT